MLSWVKRLLCFAGRHAKHQHHSASSDSDEVKVLFGKQLPKVTTSGMQMVAMVGDYDRSRLPATNDQIVLVDSRGAIVTAKCGHSSHEQLIFNVYGLEITGEGQQFCPDCSKKELTEIVIRCALCGLPILPGNAVSIYDIGGADIKADIAYRVGEDQVLGCVGMDCSLPGAFAGHWAGPKQGFISAFD